VSVIVKTQIPITNSSRQYTAKQIALKSATETKVVAAASTKQFFLQFFSQS